MELETLVQPLKRWWWLILIATVLAAGASYLATQEQPELYQARATLMIGQVIQQPNPTNTELILGQQLAQAYADIARREPLRRATMEALGLERLPTYNVRAIPNTQFLELLVLDTSAARSQVVANELANQLVLMSPGGQQEGDIDRQEFINDELDDLQLQIEATKEEIEEKQEELGNLFSAQQIDEVQTEIKSLQNKLGSLQSNYAALLAGSNQDALNVLSIIEPASLPQNPSNSNNLTTIITAAAAGFALSVGVAYLLEFLDDTVKNPDYVYRSFKIPAIACIPTINAKDNNANLIVIEQPRSPISEAFRGLRTFLNYQNKDTVKKTILVTSAHQGDGKSMISANLAAVLAAGGNKVLLVDADLRNPSLDKIFQLDRQKGLMSILNPEGKIFENGHKPSMDLLESAVQSVALSSLSILTTGPLPDMPSEILSSPQMRQWLTEVTDKYDYVVIDSPPVLAVTDAVVLSSEVESVLFITNSERTRRKELKHAIAQLNSVEAPLVGVVMNRHDSKEDGYGYYYTYSAN